MLDLDEFVAGYIQCALFTETDETAEDYDPETGNGPQLMMGFDPSDLAPEAERAIREELSTFARENRDDLDAYCDETDTWRGSDSFGYSEYSPSEQAGQNLWYSRNGHGTGFWDRGLGALGDRLQAAAKALGEQYIYVGDDGKLYVS